ncbi:MAG TPA: chromate transporter, partial [Candidatus Methylomirabilis sp.]|nr:chromate transporter [Candidatus Methylomirabilis sp.]
MRRVRLISLVREFTWAGLVSLGGGRSAYLYDVVVARRGWVSSEEFVQDLTRSQILPGSNVANLAVALGFRLAGWWGAALGLLGIVLPGAIILLVLAAIYFASGLAPVGSRLLHGMSAAVIGLIVLTTARLARAALRHRAGIAVAVLTFLAVGPLRMSTVLVIVVMAGVSAWLHRPRRLDGLAPVATRDR